MRLLLACATLSLVTAGCGYTTRPGLAPHIKTVYVQPFVNKIDFAQLASLETRFPIYRHRMEVDLTNEVLDRYQFTGLLRPEKEKRADVRLEGELIRFQRDALRFDRSSNVEQWRLVLTVDLRMYDRATGTMMWEEPGFLGETKYFVAGSGAESESSALSRAITDLARRIVERSVENW